MSEGLAKVMVLSAGYMRTERPGSRRPHVSEISEAHLNFFEITLFHDILIIF